LALRGKKRVNKLSKKQLLKLPALVFESLNFEKDKFQKKTEDVQGNDRNFNYQAFKGSPRGISMSLSTRKKKKSKLK
jgi:hypothetical protein